MALQKPDLYYEVRGNWSLDGNAYDFHIELLTEQVASIRPHQVTFSDFVPVLVGEDNFYLMIDVQSRRHLTTHWNEDSKLNPEH